MKNNNCGQRDTKLILENYTIELNLLHDRLVKTKY